VLGSAVDTALFFTIAFSGALVPLFPGIDVAWANERLPLLGLGPVAPLWASLAVADYGVKLGLALIALVPFRAVVRRVRAAA
jgi:queuosine precursor transporter